MTVPPPDSPPRRLIQYTLLAFTEIWDGNSGFVARVVTLPPSRDTFATVPSVVQYTLVPSTARELGELCLAARVVDAPPSRAAFITAPCVVQ